MDAFHSVLAEDDSDAETLKILITRLRTQLGLPKIKITTRGFEGCDNLLRKGARSLKELETIGCVRAYICLDVDNPQPGVPGRGNLVVRRNLLKRRIIKASGVSIPCCPVLPIQELEAWVLANASKLVKKFKWCAGLTDQPNPERIRNPKEVLGRLTTAPRGRYVYKPAFDNPFMARLLDLNVLEANCSSFADLAAFVRME